MSFTDDYDKLRKKRKQEEEQEKKQSKGNSFTEEYDRLKANRQTEEDDDIAPVVTSYEEYDNSPILQAMYRFRGGREGWMQDEIFRAKREANPDEWYKEDDGLEIFKSGAFSDGYDFGDVTMSILGTAGDAALEAAKGFGKVGEGLGKGIALGAAQVGDWFGADDWAEGVRDRAQRDFIDEWTEGIDKGIEKYSFLGDTTDAILQGVGQVGAVAATGGAAGAGVGTATLFGSSFGNSTSEALQNGASDEEAYTYGLMSAAAETVSEMIFGGLGKGVNMLGFSKGLSSIDDMAAKAAGKFFKSDTGKNIVEWAVKSGFEGAEEVLAGLGNAAAKKLTYMSEKDLAELVQDENLFEQFFVGAMTSGVMQSGIIPGTSNGSLIESNKTGRDFISGLSKNEQSVVDKVFKNELAKAEENGKVTNKQKNEIYNDIIERMEKGRIDTDTIEEVLGGDSFKAYKDILDSENALKEEQKALQEEQKALEEEYKQINPKNIRDMTGEEWDRREEIKARLSEIETKLNEIGTNLGDAQTNAQRNALKAQLDKDVYELTKGDRLRESFFEVVRSKQKYQADLSQYKGRAKKVIQSVMESGLADNTNETHDFWDSMANIAEAMDTDITLADDAQILEMVKAEHEADGLEFDESKFKGQQIDGYISKNGIVLNAKTKRALNFVVGHEITHKLEKTKHYAKLQKLLFEYAKDEYESRFNERSGQYSNKFKADDKYKAKVDKEVTGDLVGDYVFNDKGFIDHLAKDRNVFQRVWDEIKYMAKIAKAGSEQAKQLERVKREFERAYREANKAQSGDTKYSISETTDGRRVAVVDNDILSKIDTSTWDKTTKKEAKKAASEELKKFSDGFTINGIEFIGNSDSRREYTRSDYSEALARKNPTAYLDKMRAAAVLDDVIQVATDWNNDNELTHDREDYVDFVRGKTLIMSGDRAYRAIVLAGITSDGRAIFHDLEDIYPDSFELKKSESSTAVSANESPNRILEDSDAATVAQKDSDVKMQFSVSDSDGKRLSKGQQEYFKDSKMRDENGNLKVMYHGSQDAGFHVFDSSMSDDGTSFFFVDRNDVAASYSGTSEVYEAKAFKTADDANKFFESIGKPEYEVIEKDGKYRLREDEGYSYYTVAESESLEEIYQEFCDYEGVGYGDANYKVYLNLTNPLVVDAEGRNWNNISREYSQVIADRYNSLTAEEKAALTDLAEWGEYGVFKDEMLEARANAEQGVAGVFDEAYTKNLASAYEKLGGANANLYDAFSIASENFSEEAIQQFAVKQMNTRDYAQKAKAEGYDGVIFNNIHDNGGYSNGSEGASTVAIAFNSNQIKSVANEMPTGDADIRYSVSEAQNENGLNREQEVSFSLSNDTAYMDKAIAKNESNKGYTYHVDTRRMEEAKAVRERIAARMNEIREKGLVGLPEDIEGNTYITNSSYDGTEENTTICPRSLASEAFVDAVSEYLGRPLSVEEQIYISQDLQGRSLTPECTYCYVATDRKAYRAFLGEYINQRDAVLEKLKANPNADVSRSGKLYEEFRNGRKDTNPMYSRFKMWADAFTNGTPMVEASHLANINKLMGDINSEFGEALKPQIVDAMKYAQSASWAKKRVNYVAYNGHILNWKQDRINKLNSHYGLRMYSFSDFHPAFVLENMQMITDASVRGLKMLGYTKDTDFVDIFAPSGMNINVSTFGFESGGEVYENNIIGAEWAKAKALREQYPNVGITFVATNDTLVNWALEQDWIDVVIPYHLVRTGAEVAKAFNYTNYTSESSDVKDAGWTKGDKKYIAPTEHNNDKATYLAALAKNHLKPRFERFIDNPNYMKLVNECRQPASMSKPVQPIFNEDAANSALSKLEANGYYQPIGGSVDRMYEIAAEVAEGMTQELAPAMSISDEGQQHKDTGGYQYYSHIPGEDIAPVQEDIAPIAEKPAKVMTEAETSEDIFPDDLAPMEDSPGRLESIDDADMPPETEPYYGEEDAPVAPSDPFEDRDFKGVGKRNVKAYMYENPEVKPFFQMQAKAMLGDLQNSTKGERLYNDDLYYESGGEQGWSGTERQTTDDIAYLLDMGYTYAQIEKGLNDIIEDNGAENNAMAKRIEFALNDRLSKGYTDINGVEIPANEGYLKVLAQKEAAEAIEGQIAPYTDADAPVYDIAPVKETATEAYEAIKPQKKPSNEPRMVRADSKGKQRKWVKTSTDSDAVDGQVLPEDLDQELIHYQPISNKKTLGNANAKLNRMGYETSVSYLNSQFANNKVTLDDIALGERLVQEAVKRGDTKTAGDLIMDISILGTELGQKVQALSIIKRLTPEGQLRMLQRTVERGKTKGDKAFEGVEITQDMIDHILKTYGKDGTYDQEKLNKAVEDVKQKIADKMKVTKMDKVNAWRYLSMLGNPKTHIRNLVSNVAMRGTVAVKNVVARTIESVAPIKNRTKTWKSASDDVKKFAQQTTIEMKDIISGDSKYSESASIKEKRAIFKNKILNGLYEFNSDMLSKEDWWFSKPAFTNSLSEFLTANGITTKEDIQNNPKVVEKAKQYALEQSQIATFRQYSWLANKINEIERKNNVTDIAVGSILPFKKTPINIAKTGLNYSPLGFAKTLTYDVSQVKKGNMEASELVDHLAQNVTGSALALVGYLLASGGFLNGAGEDDKEGEYDYQLGEQAYSITIGDATFSLSWLSPVAMPLFVGANAYEQLVEGKEWNGDVVVETLAQTLDPLSEMSFISSLDSVLSSYDNGLQKFAGIVEAMIQNYSSQFVPTLSSQIATVMDDTKRSTKVAGDSDFKFVDETINKLKYKIPFLRETLEPSTDIWGNEVKQTENIITRAIETFLAPYAKRESIASDVDEEIKDLYGETGDTGLIPSIPNNYVSYDGEKYEMSAEEYTQFKQSYGQTAFDMLEELFDTKTYQNADSETRAELVNRVYDYARDEARREYFDGIGVDFTNATKDGEEYYKENSIKGAIENDVTPEEYDFSVEYPEKYKFLNDNGVTYSDYQNGSEEFKDAYSWAFNNPEKYTLSQAISSDLVAYRKYASELYDIRADKDSNGKTISGSAKEKKIEYINNLDLEYGEKIILFKSLYEADDTYNMEIIEYLNGREDISYEQMETILKELGFKVDSQGNITWD